MSTLIEHDNTVLKLKQQAEQDIHLVVDWDHATILDRLLRAANNEFKSLDIELIRCRRLGHHTRQYQEQARACEENYRRISKLILQALLMQK